MDELIEVTRKAMAKALYEKATKPSPLLIMLGGGEIKPATRWQRFRGRLHRLKMAWLVLTDKMDAC